MFSEYPPLLVQDLVLFLLIMRHEREQQQASLSPVHQMKRQAKDNSSSLRTFIACTIAVHSLIALRMFPKSVPIMAIAISSPIGITSKLLQLIEIVRHRDAGSVSFSTWFLNFISTSSRLISVILTVADKTLMFALSASAVLNLAIAVAVLIYPAAKARVNDLNEDTAMEPNSNEIKKDQ